MRQACRKQFNQHNILKCAPMAGRNPSAATTVRPLWGLAMCLWSAENPDLLASPYTDAGTIPNLKFSFSAARNCLAPGGWAREVTVRELPVSKQLAGVNMRLKPGGIRELHWHKEAEWAFMLAGRARITAIDPQGRNFIDDVGVGDLWNFPAGIPHSIQGLEEGCEFLLVFDDGNFSENETFLITDWFAHTPREVLAKNFGVPEAAFANLPTDVEHTRWISRREGARPADRGRCSVAGGSRARDVQLPLAGPGADQDGGRPGADRRLVQFPGGHHYRGGTGGDRPRRDARNALASQHGRVAVLHRRARAHDRVRLEWEGADIRLPGRRRGLRRRSRWGTTSRTRATNRCVSWRCSAAPTSPTYR